MKFLIVDDAAIVRRLVCHVLEKMGHKDYVEAIDGQDALDKLEQHAFDVILLDWAMPNVDGLEFLQRLRSRPDYKDVPVLMITSNSLPQQVTQAIEAQVTDYVVKPFSVDLLRQKVNAAIMKAQTAGCETLERLMRM